MSFVDIAREVGRQWQNIAPAVKTAWEDQAAMVSQSAKSESNHDANDTRGHTVV
jgi:hypothetical protein